MLWFHYFRQRLPVTVVRFALVGVLNTTIDAVLFVILSPMLGLLWGNLVAYSTGIVVSYGLNRFWTYGGRTTTQTHWQLLQFVIVSCSAMLINTLLVISFSVLLGNDQTSWLGLVAKGAAIGGSALWNYLLNSRWTFKQSPAPHII